MGAQCLPHRCVGFQRASTWLSESLGAFAATFYALVASNAVLLSSCRKIVVRF